MGFSRPTVLIVDDDPTIRKFLVEALSLEGYPLETATGGAEALAALKKSGQSRVILLDLLMPKPNGWDVMRELAATPEVRAKHRIVLMSALSNLELEETRSFAIDGQLSKPFSVEQLFNVIASASAA
jgi:CheY-like chemotaxis protein